MLETLDGFSTLILIFLDNCNVCPVSDTVAVMTFVFLVTLLETGSLYKVDE